MSGGKVQPSSAMSPEEAEEMFSRPFWASANFVHVDLSPRRILGRLGTLVYGSSVGSADRRPRLSIRVVLQESGQRLSGGYRASAQRIGGEELHLGKRCFDLSGLKLNLLNCAKPNLDCCLA